MPIQNVRRPPQCSRLSTCPYCYANFRMTENYPGHRYYKKPLKSRRVYKENVVIRPTMDQEASAANCGCADHDFATLYPTLTAYLSDPKWDDGTARECSSMALSVQNGQMCLALNDKAFKRSIYTTAGSLEAALLALDEALREGTGVWRQWKPGAPKK